MDEPKHVDHINVADVQRIGEPCGVITADKLDTAEERLALALDETDRATVALRSALKRNDQVMAAVLRQQLALVRRQREAIT